MKKYILTLDIGTTSLKTTIFTNNLKPELRRNSEYKIVTKTSNIFEMDAEAFWSDVVKSVKELTYNSKILPEEVTSIAITTQGETLIPIDRNGNVLGPAIIWLDNRAVEESKYFISKIGHDLFYRTTGIPKISPAVPVCKIKWYKDNHTEIYEKAYKYLLLEDYLIYKMTKRFVTNFSLIGTTGYYDINNNKLYDSIIDIGGLDPEKIPKVLSPGSIVGPLTEDAAKELNLTKNTVVTTCAIDQVCAAIGAGNIRSGIVTEVTGTCQVLGVTTDKPEYGSNSNFAFLKHYNEKFLEISYNPTAGMVLKWFKDNFCESETKEAEKLGIPSYEYITKAAEKISPGSEGLILLPYYAGKLSPDANPYASGVIFGVGLQTNKAHFIRAILESVAYMLRENIDYFEYKGIEVYQIRSIGGGAKSVLWNKIKADISGKPIKTMKQNEAASLGAAILCAVSMNYFESVEDACDKVVEFQRTYRPEKEKTAKYDKFYRIYLELYDKIKSVYIK